MIRVLFRSVAIGCASVAIFHAVEGDGLNAGLWFIFAATVLNIASKDNDK